jgi:ribose transport system permease protein
VKSFFERYGVLVAFIVMCAGFSIGLPSRFPTHENLLIILTTQIPIMPIALAVTILLRTNEFDLSVSSMLVLSGLVCGTLSLHGLNLVTVIVVALLVGAAVGATNAFLILVLQINGFIATLGMSSVLAGVGYGISGGLLVTPTSPALLDFSRDSVDGVPAAVIYSLGIAIVLWVVFEYTPIGRYWLFSGGNAEAARSAGVPVRKVKAIALILSGVICAFGGILSMGNIGSVDPASSTDYLLLPFSAAFVGTALIQSGRFNIIGTVVGVFLLSVASDGLGLVGAPVWFSQVFSGGILIVALAVGRFGAYQTSGRARRLLRGKIGMSALEEADSSLPEVVREG